MRHDPQTPTIDNTQRQEGSRTDVAREQAKAQQANDARDNARKLGDAAKPGPAGGDNAPR